MAKIKQIIAREILDSRGIPTVETKVILDNGLTARAAVASGASTGVHEAVELRDGDPNRFLGKGVLKAVANVNEIIAPTLLDLEINQLSVIDQKMLDLDGTENKSKLGANAILSVSLACCRAASLNEQTPLYKYIRSAYSLPLTTFSLPTPMFLVMEGGKHSDAGLAVQEFMIIPQARDTFAEKLRMGVEIFSALRMVLEKRGLRSAVGDEGGFAPRAKTVKNALDLMIDISNYTHYKLGEEVFFALDVAASVFYQENKKQYRFENKNYSSKKMIEIYLSWFKKYPFLVIEDPLAEDDWESWPIFTKEVLSIRPGAAVIGDDIFSTNLKRLQRGLSESTANAMIIKPNQVGTITEVINCVKEAKKNNYKIVVSQRAGEPNDDFIADLAVAINADYIKTGAPNRGERVAKYNRLLEIEQELK
ncbi:MAG: phosphopyruvate hydratase [Patescibacteria group bacterium]|nr:phosphopyruvate hydratase [Patescibacteria group bacterium]MDD5121354.1 phosphopyruvate hydratase [Patescibacteria group bacterium]MDD5222066.1 phosphopyruvate hydratase [Patescibacteria group bacterium]MDD5395727.1 phosphopyruvate hydratase [Patescibacteria group bacterium]